MIKSEAALLVGKVEEWFEEWAKVGIDLNSRGHLVNKNRSERHDQGGYQSMERNFGNE